MMLLMVWLVETFICSRARSKKDGSAGALRAFQSVAKTLERSSTNNDLKKDPPTLSYNAILDVNGLWLGFASKVLQNRMPCSLKFSALARTNTRPRAPLQLSR